MMKEISFAQSMKTQLANSYKRNGPAEILAGSGLMNTAVKDNKK